MNLIFIRPPCSTALGTVVVCALLVVGCKKEKTTIAPIQTIEVTAVKVEPYDVPITFEWVAQTDTSPQVDIRARLEGILEKRVYKEGAIVQEGQVMFEMERKPFEARLDAAKAGLGQEDARLANAQQTLERVLGLSERNEVIRHGLGEATNSDRREPGGSLGQQRP